MLYVHLKNTVRLEKNKEIRVGDVAQLYLGIQGQDENARAAQEAEYRKRIVGRTGGTKSGATIVTGIDLARVLHGNTELVITGAPFCSVVLKPIAQHGMILPWVKTAVIIVLLFSGGAMTIMNFQTDVDMQNVHRTLSEILAGKGSNPLWVSIPYSVGIGCGVLFFSNLLPGKRKKPSIFELEQFQMDSELKDFESSKAEDRL